MKKWIALALLSLSLAACTAKNDEAVDRVEDDAADLITPYDNDNNNGNIKGVNDGTNGSDRGLYMNGDNANVESPTTNKDNSGDFKMDGAGGTNGEPGNNVINEGVNNDLGGTSGTGNGIPNVNNKEDMIEDRVDRKDADRKDE